MVCKEIFLNQREKNICTGCPLLSHLLVDWFEELHFTAKNTLFVVCTALLLGDNSTLLRIEEVLAY